MPTDPKTKEALRIFMEKLTKIREEEKAIKDSDTYLERVIKSFPEDYSDYGDFYIRTLTETVMTAPDQLLDVFAVLAEEYVVTVERIRDAEIDELVKDKDASDRLDKLIEEFLDSGLSNEEFISKYVESNPDTSYAFISLLDRALIEASDEDFSDE